MERLDRVELTEKRIRKLSRSLRSFTALLTVSVSAGVSSLLSQQLAALAQPSSLIAVNPGDLVCYMQTSDGRLLNLNKLCGSEQLATSLSPTDQRFLDRYSALLRRRSMGLPAIQTALLQAQQNPQAVLQRAQAFCAALRTGQFQPNTSGQVGDDLVTTMAPRYYCPELED